MFKRCFVLLLALCLLLTSTSVAFMEEGLENTVLDEFTLANEAMENYDGIDAAEEVVDAALALEEDAPAEETAETPEETTEKTAADNTEENEPAADNAEENEPVAEPSEEDIAAVEEALVEEIAEEASYDYVAEEAAAVEDEPAAETALASAETPAAEAPAANEAAALEGEATPAEFVLTGNAKHTMSRGDTLQINLNGLTAKSFKSSKKKVASVTATGLVTAKAKGKTKITATISKKKKLVLTLTVVDPTMPTKVYLTKDGAAVSGTITVNLSEPITLVPVAETASGAAPDTAFKWSSSKKKVATVSGGVITPKKAGTTKITVKTTRGKKKATIKVKVVDPYKATKVTLNETGLIYVFRKNTLQLTATLEPSNTTSTIKWSSSNKKVASVSKTGLVTAKKKGKAVITCKASSGVKARVTIRVINRGGTAKGMIPEWSPDEANHFVYRGAVDTYVVSMDPFNANANVTWTTDNPNVLSVVSYAQSGDLSFWCDVQGVNNGVATLTATDSVSGLSQSVAVTVKEPPAPESITLPMGGVVNMAVGADLNVPYVVNPSTSLNNNANRATVSYDTGIATITYDSNNADRNCLGTMDYNLHIHANAPGSTVVTITLKNGVSASFTLVIG